jgi:hypothetical protein
LPRRLGLSRRLLLTGLGLRGLLLLMRRLGLSLAGRLGLFGRLTRSLGLSLTGRLLLLPRRLGLFCLPRRLGLRRSLLTSLDLRGLLLLASRLSLGLARRLGLFGRLARGLGLSLTRRLLLLPRRLGLLGLTRGLHRRLLTSLDLRGLLLLAGCLGLFRLTCRLGLHRRLLIGLRLQLRLARCPSLAARFSLGHGGLGPRRLRFLRLARRLGLDSRCLLLARLGLDLRLTGGSLRGSLLLGADRRLLLGQSLALHLRLSGRRGVGRLASLGLQGRLTRSQLGLLLGQSRALGFSLGLGLLRGLQPLGRLGLRLALLRGLQSLGGEGLGLSLSLL